MVTALDEAIGNVVKALKDNNMYDDTIIVFTADVKDQYLQYHIFKSNN